MTDETTNDTPDNIAIFDPKKARQEKQADAPKTGNLTPATLADAWMLLLGTRENDGELDALAVQRLREQYDKVTTRETKIYVLKNILIMTEVKSMADWAAGELMGMAKGRSLDEMLEIYAVVAAEAEHDISWLGQVSDAMSALFKGDKRDDIIDYIEDYEVFDNAHMAEFMADTFLREFAVSDDADYCARFANALIRAGDLLSDETRERVVVALVSLVASDVEAAAFMTKKRKQLLKDIVSLPDGSETVDWGTLLAREHGESANAAKKGKLVSFTRKKPSKEE